MQEAQNKSLLRDQRFTITVSLLATSVVAIIQMITLQHLDKPQIISVSSFAISIPLLGFDVYATLYESLNQKSVSYIPRKLARFIGCCLVIIGFNAFFWHFFWWLGMLFLLSGIISIGLWYRFQVVYGQS